jgi:hypothetical protein
VRFRSAAGLPLFLFLADCIINIAGSEFSAGTAASNEVSRSEAIRRLIEIGG